MKGVTLATLSSLLVLGVAVWAQSKDGALLYEHAAWDRTYSPGAKGMPRIPKGWVLVAVERGDTVVGGRVRDNLWFRGSDGSVFLVRAFTATGQITISDVVNQVEAE